MERRGYSMPGVYVFGIILFALIILHPIKVHAGGEDARYVWISVDATDDNSGLTYALDTTDPEAFGPTSRFQVLEGTSHTIYVKDIAGNITSQEYSAISVDRTDNTDTGDINLDIEVGNENLPEYVPGTFGKGEGTGTLMEETQTDGSPDSDKLFYTVESQDGSTFYLVVDHTDQEDNVYFLDQVRLNDLQSLAVEGGQNLNQKTENTDAADGNNSLLGQLSGEKKDVIDDVMNNQNTKSSSKKNGSVGFVPVVIVLLFTGVYGAYYYFRIYTRKKDEALDLQDAHDMEDFEGEYDDDDDYNKYEIDDDDDEEEAFDSVSSSDELDSATVSDAYLKEMAEDTEAESRNAAPIDYPDSIPMPQKSEPEPVVSEPSTGFSFGSSSSVDSSDDYNKFGDESEEDI